MAALSDPRDRPPGRSRTADDRAEHIAVLRRLRVGRLVGAIERVSLFHPMGMPHQLQIANMGELWGMEPVAETADGKVLIGYPEGEPPAPEEMPWQTGSAAPRIEATRAAGPEARRWLPAYERQLSEIGELAIVVQDRLGAIPRRARA
jgi:hypothetical protein